MTLIQVFVPNLTHNIQTDIFRDANIALSSPSTALIVSSHTRLCESFRCLHQSSSSAAFADHSPERQVQARFLLSAYNLAAASPSDFQILPSLQGGGENGDSSFLHSLLSAVFPPLPVPISPELTAALLAEDKVNGFRLMEPFSVSN
ncbi:hypothetical protein Bca101_082605 [Brassica carinata]